MITHLYQGECVELIERMDVRLEELEALDVGERLPEPRQVRHLVVGEDVTVVVVGS